MDAKPKRKWWNYRVRLALFFGIYALLFLIGKYSATYEPDPVYDGRKLSEWTGDITCNFTSDPKSQKAAAVLKAHQQEIKPVLIRWLDERDTIPQRVYFFTMEMLEWKKWDFLDYRGAYQGQARAAYTFQVLGERDPEVISSLQRVIRHHGDRHWTSDVAKKALGELSR